MRLIFTLCCLLLLACRTDVRSAEAMADNSVTVAMQMPNPGYNLKLASIHQVGDEAWVLVQITPPKPGMMMAQVITDRSVTAAVPTETSSHRVYVLGKKWGWGNQDEHVYLDDRQAFLEALYTGTRVDD